MYPLNANTKDARCGNSERCLIYQAMRFEPATSANRRAKWSEQLFVFDAVLMESSRLPRRRNVA
jgi:hypothetical protein